MNKRGLALLAALAAVLVGGTYGLIDHADAVPPSARDLAREHYLRALDYALVFDHTGFHASIMASVTADPTYLPSYFDYRLSESRPSTTQARELVRVANRIADPRLRRCVTAAVEIWTTSRIDADVGPGARDDEAAFCETWFYFNVFGEAGVLPSEEQSAAALRRYPESFGFLTSALQALYAGGRYDQMARQIDRIPTSDLHPLVRATLAAYEAHSLHTQGKHGAALRVERLGWRFATKAGPGALGRFADHLSGLTHDGTRSAELTAAATWPAGAQRRHRDSVTAELHRVTALVRSNAPVRIALSHQVQQALRQLDVGELRAADAAFTRLLPLVEAAHDTVLLAFVHMRRGRARVKLGKANAAELDLFRARELAAGRDSTIGYESEHNLLHLYESLQRDADAEAAGLRFIARASHSAGPAVRVMSHRDLALFYQLRGRTAEATRQYRAMAAAADRYARDYQWVGEYYELIGHWDRARAYYLRTTVETDAHRAYAGLARIALAQENYEEALEHARTHDRLIELVGSPEALPMVPTVLRGASDLPRAAAVIDSLRKRAQVAGAVARWAALTTDRAELTWRQRLFDRAEQWADSASAAARSVGLVETEIRAGALAALARYARAACCDDGAGVAIAQFDSIVARAHATGFVSLEQEVLGWLGDAHALARRLEPALDAYTRAATLADSIAASMRSDPARAGYRATTVNISNRALAAIARSASGNAAELFAAWSMRRKARELRGSFVPPFDQKAWRGVRSRLGPHTAIVDYIALDTALLALVITSDTAVVRQLPLPRAHLRALSQRLRAQLDARVGGTIDLRRSRLDAAAAHELYRRLLEPLERDWPGRTRLLVVADAELHALPFDALSLDRDGRTYVLDRYQITMLPSLGRALLPRLQARSAVRRVLAVGAADVPGATDELEAIARAFPDRAVRLSGPAATRDNVRAQLQPGTTLHFAVHAVPNNVDPEHAFLKLHPDSNDAGELRAFEIVHWPLRDSFVVLSACETGVGRVFDAEGVLSLARAFFTAGADDVVATLWPVSGSVAELMTHFYAALAAGSAPDDALHRAKLRLRHEPSTRNPFHWAAFQLIAGSL